MEYERSWGREPVGTKGTTTSDAKSARSLPGWRLAAAGLLGLAYVCTSQMSVSSVSEVAEVPRRPAGNTATDPSLGIRRTRPRGWMLRRALLVSDVLAFFGALAFVEVA